MQVRLDGPLAKIQCKVNKDGDLKTVVSIEAELSPADIGRLAGNLGKRVFAVVTSEQLSFDDLMAQVAGQ